MRSAVTRPWPEVLLNENFRLEDKRTQDSSAVDEHLERLTTPFEATVKENQSETNVDPRTTAPRLKTTQDYRAKVSPLTSRVKPPGKVAIGHGQECRPAYPHQQCDASLRAKWDSQTPSPKPEADASLRKRGWFGRVSRSKAEPQHELGQSSQPHGNRQFIKPFQDTGLRLPAFPVGMLRRKNSYTNHHGNSQDGGKGSGTPDPKSSYNLRQRAAFSKRNDDCLRLCRVAQASNEDGPPCCPRPILREAHARSRARTPTTPLSRQ